jgi:hypothetical protein
MVRLRGTGSEFVIVVVDGCCAGGVNGVGMDDPGGPRALNKTIVTRTQSRLERRSPYCTECTAR